MRKLMLWLMLTALVLGAGPTRLLHAQSTAATKPNQPAVPETNKAVDEALRSVRPFIEKFTGLSFKQTPIIEVVTRQDYLKLMQAEAARDRSALRKQLTILQALGLIKQRADEVERAVLKLYESASVGAYSHRDKKLRLILEPGQSLDYRTMVHELIHALHDQHFDLKSVTEASEASEEARFARHAVVEGFARLGEEVFTRGFREDGSTIPSLQMLREIQQRARVEIKNTYRDLRGQDDRQRTMDLIHADSFFPYVWGLHYVAGQAAENLSRWKTWNERLLLSEQLPASSRQVFLGLAAAADPRERFQPDTSFVHTWVQAHPSWEVIEDKGVIGDFYWRMLVGEKIAEAAACNIGWSADRLIVLAEKDDGETAHATAVALVLFESEPHARRGEAQYQKLVSAEDGQEQRRLQRLGRLLVVSGPGCPEKLFASAVTSARATSVPVRALRADALLMLLEQFRATGSAEDWQQFATEFPKVANRAAVVTGLERQIRSDEPITQEVRLRACLRLGEQLASADFVRLLRGPECRQLAQASLQILEHADALPVQRLNALRLGWALRAQLSGAEMQTLAGAAETLGPDGLRIAAALRAYAATLTAQKGASQ